MFEVGDYVTNNKDRNELRNGILFKVLEVNESTLKVEILEDKHYPRKDIKEEWNTEWFELVNDLTEWDYFEVGIVLFLS